MEKIQRIFLVVEGQHDGYPNYESAKVHVTDKDPAELNLKNLFICSPLFATDPLGASKIPTLEKKGTMITFIMVPNIFPSFKRILALEKNLDCLWFGIGLANLVVLESGKNKGITAKIIGVLKKEKNISAFEQWSIKNHKICKEVKPVHVFNHSETDVENVELKISDNLPLHLKFSVSEYIISINKFLTASKKFTPHYYKQHSKTIGASMELINDICFLYDDDFYQPTDALLQTLNAKSVSDAKIKLNTPLGKKLKEDLINERNGRLIQFNSSLSYIYSQAYSGVFPIFDHIGIVRRHSLLGIGTAVAALFELICQVEYALFCLPFESVEFPIYKRNIPQDDEYLAFLLQPSNFLAEVWRNDEMRKTVTESPINIDTSIAPNDYFNRLSFFSGRLGFREYDFSATAAIQVLVEANSLEWHVINYTHEIIHNHVRIILNSLITSPHSIRKLADDSYLDHFLQLFTKLYRKQKIKLTYKEYFILILICFSVLSQFHGSLTKESDSFLKDKIIDGSTSDKYFLPGTKKLRELILSVYKDISEIFVHIIDYSYVYVRNIDVYIKSIWASWSTVMAVSFDLRQYILRSLLVISASIDGKPSVRFKLSKQKFLLLLHEMKETVAATELYASIRVILEDESDDDLRLRYYNCLMISDLCHNFFVGNLQTALDMDDQNLLGINAVDEFGNAILYDLETNSFDGNKIVAKTRLLLDQVLRECETMNAPKSDNLKEKTSAWLLLTLSSYNHD